MDARLRLVLAVTAIFYTLWIVGVLIIGRSNSGIGVTAANLIMGIMFGMMAALFTDHDAPQLFIQDALVNLVFFTALAFMFAAFSLRSNFIYGELDFFGSPTVDWRGLWTYLSYFMWRGAIFGLLLWGLALVNVGFVHASLARVLLSATACMVGLLSAPFIANWLFNGALFLVVAVGVRIAFALYLVAIPVWWRGFLLGATSGFTLVMLPFLGYFGYGAL